MITREDIREIGRAGRYILDLFGVAAVLAIIGLIVAAAAKGKNPDPHNYRWFMSQACPKSYRDFSNATASRPLFQSQLYEACLKEVRPPIPTSITFCPGTRHIPYVDAAHCGGMSSCDRAFLTGRPVPCPTGPMMPPIPGFKE